jgi:calcium/calmodulin-dependent protein kinase IV
MFSCFKRSKTMTLMSTVDAMIASVFPTMGDVNDNRRYKSVNQIGNGGYAKVWKVLDTHTNEEMAMKVSSSRYANCSLEKEYFILRKFNNPHIISPIAFYYDRRSLVTTHMILPFMKKDLFTHAVEEKRDMSEKELRKLVIDITNAIKHVHDKDIVHRDIKPENILIDDNGDYVLCDFGNADKDGLFNLNGLIGSVHYMAPEVAYAYLKRNRNTIPFAIGKQTDIFSFGMTLYNVATLTMGGADPTNKSDTDFIDEISSFDMMPQVDKIFDRSDAFKDLLRMMLYRSPIARITADEILAHPFVTGK